MTATRTTPRPGSSSTRLATRASRQLPDGSRALGQRRARRPRGPRRKAWFSRASSASACAAEPPQGGAARDRNRLASLSAEGRSSATTVLVGSALRWMHGADSDLAEHSRKLLGFTDNRQDAALQSGHFNDFLFVSLIRAAFLGALEMAGDRGLRSDELGVAQQRALGFDRPTRRFAPSGCSSQASRASTSRKPRARCARCSRTVSGSTSVAAGATRTPTSSSSAGRGRLPRSRRAGRGRRGVRDAPDVLRFASPLARKLRSTASSSITCASGWRSAARSSSRPHRADARRSRTVACARLGASASMRSRAGALAHGLAALAQATRRCATRTSSRAVAPAARSASCCARRPRPAVDGSGTIAPRCARSSPRTSTPSSWRSSSCLRPRPGLRGGHAVRRPDGWRLNDACVLFKRERLWSIRSSQRERVLPRLLRQPRAHASRPGPPALRLRGPRAHRTGRRREARGAREALSLRREGARGAGADEKHLREIGEANRFLPVLFCSPTMELGVDISALNAVYLRNVPPTPANYAQRSGRAGRSGQAALVLTYCSSQSPHDQYFFRDPEGAWCTARCARRCSTSPTATWSRATSRRCGWRAPRTPRSVDRRAARARPAGAPAQAEVLAPMHTARTRTTPAHPPRARSARGRPHAEALAPWYPGRDEFANEVVAGRSAGSTRRSTAGATLFAAAEQQRDAAHRTDGRLLGPARREEGRQEPHLQAIDQLELLQKGTSSQSSDFYTYRYLATEGFLPGYNFPRLPLMAYVPATNDGRGRRPTSSGRGSLPCPSSARAASSTTRAAPTASCGRCCRSATRATPRSTRLPTKSVRICKCCGAGHFNDQVSTATPAAPRSVTPRS
jgi:hypothetical protein